MNRATCLVLLVVVTACGGDDYGSRTPVTPSAPVAPACQTNNTAAVSFGNRSANTTIDAFWDGLKAATLTPGQTSGPLTASAQVAHRLEFRITNSNQFACITSNPIPVRCDTPVYTCAYP